MGPASAPSISAWTGRVGWHEKGHTGGTRDGTQQGPGTGHAGGTGDRTQQGQDTQEGQETGHTGGTGDGAVLGDLQDVTGPAENDG